MGKVYIAGDSLRLVAYIDDDYLESYKNWYDTETQTVFNFV